MKMMLLAVASLSALPIYASQDRTASDRCQQMDIMMGVHKAEPVTPDRIPEMPLVPKTKRESTGPAVLIPNCRKEDPRRRKKGDYPLA